MFFSPLRSKTAGNIWTNYLLLYTGIEKCVAVDQKKCEAIVQIQIRQSHIPYASFIDNIK